jgi:signal transduction histidine kinase
MASLIDLSKTKQVKKKVHNSEEKLRAQSRKIIKSQEDERKRVAKELHDSIGGNLAAIKFALEQKLASMNDGPRDDIYSLENIIANIKDTIKELRRICNDLIPSVLVDLGLIEAIRWFCREQKKYYNNVRIITQLEVEENNISKQLGITIFRVIQEAMNNAFRHGEADVITVRLMNSGYCIDLSVRDNGCGFDPNHIPSNPSSLNGFGLKGMKDRAEVCDGTFEIISETGKGTQVKFSFPNVVQE